MAESLVNVRNVEMPGCVVDYFRDYDIDEERVFLPPYDLPLVNSLYKQQQLQGDSSIDHLKEHLRQRRQIIANRDGQTTNVDRGDEVGEKYIVTDDGRRPSTLTIINEVRSRLDTLSVDYDQVVIAGEGEPTLRMDALLAISRAVRDYSDDNSTNKGRKHPAVRVITNGLCYGIPNLGYSPNNLDRDGIVIPVHRNAILRDMTDAGVTRLSVALNTANRHEYDVLMEPSCHTGGSVRPGTAHDLVCELIVEATKIGMDVEITGIDRPGIDKIETERLARMLLSVRKGDNDQRRSAFRWRRYFD